MAGVTVANLEAWLREFARLIAENKDHLTQLDSAIGDADHGINMERGMQAVVSAIDTEEFPHVSDLFKKVGMTLVTTVGGALPALMDAEVRAARAAGRTILEGYPPEIGTLEGVRGPQLLTFEPTLPIERYRRIVLFPLVSGRVLRLAFEATPDLDTPEVDAMIAQVGIGAAP